MADLQTQYVLTTPGGTITFNTGQLRDGTDKYWIQNIEGLDGASLRIPMDPVPFADGALLHTSYRDARHILIEGVLVTETAGFPGGGDACVQRQNEMEDDLLDALESIIATDGTLAWTPLGLSARSLTVRRDQTAEFAPGENFAIKTFTFGLIAADPTW